MAEGSGAITGLASHVPTNGQPFMVPVSALDEALLPHRWKPAIAILDGTE